MFTAISEITWIRLPSAKRAAGLGKSSWPGLPSGDRRLIWPRPNIRDTRGKVMGQHFAEWAEGEEKMGLGGQTWFWAWVVRLGFWLPARSVP